MTRMKLDTESKGRFKFLRTYKVDKEAMKQAKKQRDLERFAEENYGSYEDYMRLRKLGYFDQAY